MATKMTGLIKQQGNAVQATGGKKTMKDIVVSMQGEIKRALPSVITPERFSRMVMTALSTNTQLQECTPNSFLGAMLQAAQLGLEPNTTLGQCYLIPRRNKGQMEASFQLGYHGLLELAYRSGEVIMVQAHAVHEKDEFEYELGLEPKLVHKPCMTGDKGDVVAYYGMYKCKNGGCGFHVMSVADIQAHAKQYSQSYSSSYSPWTTNFDSMAKKGLAIDTPIPTVNGWKHMGDMLVGDVVFDMYGNQTKVIAVSEEKHLDCFEVTFSNGEKIICDNEHRWVAEYGENCRRKVKEKGWQTLTINELYNAKQQSKTIIIPVSPCCDMPKQDLLIPPYLLGYWLGDGSKRHASFTCNADEWHNLKPLIEKAIKGKYTIGTERKDKRSKALCVGIVGGFLEDLKKENLYCNKHIPIKYLRSSKEQRIELLRGLMDSDGTIEKIRGRAIFCSTNKLLSDAVYELVSSLGEVASYANRQCKGFGKTVVCYRIEWKPSTCNPASLKSKANRVKARIVEPYKSIKSIKKIDSVTTKCIAVDAESKTYLAGYGFIPTHNTVIKQALKYAPLKTEFVRGMATDETIKSEISENMVEVQNEMDYIDAEVSEGQETVIAEEGK